MIWRMSIETLDVDGNTARIVRTLRTYHGLAPEDVAAAIGISVPTLERRLSRKRGVGDRWKAEEVYRLAAYFGMPIGVFFGDGMFDVMATSINPPKQGPAARSRCTAPSLKASRRGSMTHCRPMLQAA